MYVNREDLISFISNCLCCNASAACALLLNERKPYNIYEVNTRVQIHKSEQNLYLFAFRGSATRIRVL